MATGGQKESGYNLVNVGTLTLGTAALDPMGIVVDREMLMITDWNTNQVHVYRRHDGKLLSTLQLEAGPYGICCVNDREICIALENGTIKIMSVEDTGVITRDTISNLKTPLDRCYGVGKFMDKVVVSGVKQDTVCWCVVSRDRHVDAVHNICEGSWCFLTTTKTNMVYISCPDSECVYGYNILNPRQQPFTYKYDGPWYPLGITVDDNGYLFVCDSIGSIYHLTDQCRLVTKYMEGRPRSPWDIFWDHGILYVSSFGSNKITLFKPEYPHQQPFTYKYDGEWSLRGITVDDNGYLFVCDYESIYHLTDQCLLVTKYMKGIPRNPRDIFWDHGILYVASWGRRNKITLFKPEYPHQQVLPPEILRMDEKSKHLFKEALKKGEEKVYNIRVMVVGHGGVGKTTLIKRLLGKEVNIQERCATEGIDVDMHCCDVSIKTFEWKVRQTDSEDSKEDALILRLAKVVNEETPKAKVSDQSEWEIHPSKKHPDNENRSRENHFTVENPVKIKQEHEKYPESKQQVPSTPGIEKQSKPAISISKVGESQNTDLKGDNLHSLLCEKAPKLPRSRDEYASLAVWDFAGQYAFYTTHQTFMTRRAIYLLVSDVSEKLDNAVDDECFLDSRGKIKCHVRELVEVWLNSIHSCASSPEEGIPPVILVGTHVDQIRQGDSHEVCESYFKEVRTYLKDKPSRFHLVNEEFAIDNTVVDSRLENLKRKIVEVASQQKYWGEKIPAQWLPLEQALMKLRRDGKKVIHRSVLEDLAATHQISTDQLDLFLRFQHDIGTILYFSIEILKKKIVLDPKWMIDALNSLINADDMDVMRNNPKVSEKVSVFKKYGILYPDLIDAIWTKEQYREFRGNKEHVLLLMEQLNIIAKPRTYVASEIKEEEYFLAPCMLSERTPIEVISPKPWPDMESSSVLCYVFVEKYLPSPIFHRLVAACLAHWPIAKKNSENLIFCGCCSFDLDLHHRLTMFFREHVIFVRVTRMGTTEKTSKLCIEAKEFITMTLNDVIGYLGQSLRFELFIQCPEYDGYSVNCLIRVADLESNVDVPCHFHHNSHMIMSHEMLKFWFQKEGQTGIGGHEVKKKKHEPSTFGKLHRNVLNRCLPELLKDLDFKAVSNYIYQKELFDEVTMLEISEQRTIPDKTRELIKRIQQRDQDTYEKFKECLVQAKQAFLKDMLEKEESKFAIEIKVKKDADFESTKTAQKTAAPKTRTPTTPVPTVQAPVTKASATAEPSATAVHPPQKQNSRACFLM